MRNKRACVHFRNKVYATNFQLSANQLCQRWLVPLKSKPLLSGYLKAYAHKNLYVNVYSSIIFNDQKIKKKTWMSINLQMDKPFIYRYIYTMEYYSVRKINEVLIYATSANLENMLSERSQAQTVTCYDSMYIQCPE